MSHALERINPTGRPFQGKCIKCGAEPLGMSDALKPCPADQVVSDEAALIQIIERPSHDQS